ncbi:putative transposase, partial [Escherichia coli FDA506]
PACVRKSAGAGFLRQWPEPEVGGRHHVLCARSSGRAWRLK